MAPARRFEQSEGSSRKFWEVQAEGTELTVRFGKIGTAGQMQTKSLPSADACAKELEKLVREKVKKGYAEVGSARAEGTPKAPAAKAKSAAPTSSRDLGETFRNVLDLGALANPHVVIPPPATEQELAELEAKIGRSLPRELRTLLTISNGPTVPIWNEEGHLQSTTELLESWTFCTDGDVSDEVRGYVPFAVENGIYAYLAGEKIHAWDPDGEAFGDTTANDRVAKSLLELLQKREAKLRRALPKGVPHVPGFAFGAMPSDAVISEIIGSLAKSKQPIGSVLQALARNESLLTSILEKLLARGSALLDDEANDELLASNASKLDVDVLLAALGKREVKQFETYGFRYFEGWSEHMDAVMVALLARAPDKVAAAAPSFAPSVRDGYTLARRRLGMIPLSEVPRELQVRVALEGNPPVETTVVDGRGTKKVPAPQPWERYDFAFGAFYTDMEDHARIVLEHVLASEGRSFGREVVGPCLRVATATEAAKVLGRMSGRFGPQVNMYDILQNVDIARRPLTALLTEAVRELAKTATTPSRQHAAWASYVVATREGQPLPDFDALVTGLEVVSPDGFAKEFAATLARLGSERIKVLFSSYPSLAEGLAS